MRWARALSLSMATASIVGAGCATPPEKIAAAKVDAAPYAAMDCGALAAEGVRLRKSLGLAEAAQRRQRENDTIGVLMVGLPMGSMAGGKENEQAIARFKGQQAAIDATQKTKGCMT
jgi:hypothetical protein